MIGLGVLLALGWALKANGPSTVSAVDTDAGSGNPVAAPALPLPTSSSSSSSSNPGPRQTTTSTEPTSTTSTSDSTDQDARDQLDSTHQRDVSRFTATGQWSVQLGSMWIGLSGPQVQTLSGTHTWLAVDVLGYLREMKSRFGDDALLLQATDLGRQVAYPNKPAGEPLWVMLYSGNLSSRAAAEQWCVTAFPNLSGNDLHQVCLPRTADAPHT
jgi:hypothetical protein